MNQDLMVFSRNNLPKQIKDGAYLINLDKHKDTGTHWVTLFCMLFTLIALVLNIYLTKLKNLLVIET